MILDSFTFILVLTFCTLIMENTVDDDDVELHVPGCRLTYEALMMMIM